MTTKEQKQVDKILKAYSLIEEYVCLLVGSSESENNETITYSNKLVHKANLKLEKLAKL